jgi:hypothetical protein
MTIKELKDDEVFMEVLRDFVREGYCPEDDPDFKLDNKKNLVYKENTVIEQVIDGERDYSCYFYVFTINGQHYKWDGSYDSWAGTEMDSIEDFYPVKKVERVVEDWEALK